MDLWKVMTNGQLANGLLDCVHKSKKQSQREPWTTHLLKRRLRLIELQLETPQFRWAHILWYKFNHFLQQSVIYEGLH